jgi:hypothetical protein
MNKNPGVSPDYPQHRNMGWSPLHHGTPTTEQDVVVAPGPRPSVVRIDPIGARSAWS